MSQQLPLTLGVPSDPPPYLPFQAHSETSREAAEQAESAHDTERARVLRYFVEVGAHGATDDEIQQTGINPSTERPRRIELVQQGLVVDSGKKRLTLRGRRNATVWVLARYAGDPT